MKGWRTAIAGVVLVVGTTALAPPSRAADAPQLAFRRDDGHGGQIIVADADGSRPQRVDHDGMAARRAPAWSPDRRTIAYSASSVTGATPTVFVVDVSSGASRKVAAGSAPAWSPGGEALAVTTEDGALASVDVATGAVHVLEDGSGGDRTHLCPVWSPDGSRVAAAATSFGTGGHAGPDGSQRNEVVVLTRSGAVVSRFDLGPDSSCPTWSPDGTQLAVSVVDRSRHIVVLDVTGHVVRRFDPPPCAEDAWPSWSPAGLAFDRSFPPKSSLDVLPSGCADPKASGVWLVVGGGQPEQVGRTGDRVLQLGWSSDLRSIVGTAQRLVGSRYVTDVVLVGRDGTVRHLPTPDGMDDAGVVATSWLPVPSGAPGPVVPPRAANATTSSTTTPAAAALPASSTTTTALAVRSSDAAPLRGQPVLVGETGTPRSDDGGDGVRPVIVGAVLLAAVGGAAVVAQRRRRATPAP